MPTMRAARLHESGKPLQVDEVPVPSIRSDEVLVEVAACGIVQNLRNVVGDFKKMAPEVPLPPLPAIFGLDPAGTIVSVGSAVTNFKPGERVYINPARFCGGCRACHAGQHVACDSFALNGYFGLGKNSARMLDLYPYGGLCQFMPAPQHSLVKLPDSVDFSMATRLGYLGTAYRGLLKANVGAGKVVLINGITGTLGLGAVALALAMGARKVLGTARDESLFARVKGLAATGQIEILKSGSQPLKQWSDAVTAGHGIDVVVDALGPGAPYGPMVEALQALNRGGYLVDIGAVQGEVPIDMFAVLSNDITIVGSTWFTTKQAQEMVDLIDAGILDCSFYDHQIYSLDRINQALDDTNDRQGGFTNYVIKP